MKQIIKEKLLIENQIYHVVSRSIAQYQIFNTDNDYTRMVRLIRFYQRRNPPIKFSMFLRSRGIREAGFEQHLKNLVKDQEKLVEIIAYCLMPNHLHLSLKQLREHGISIFMSNLLNSYTRYFNILHKRKGPLWESRFKHILVEKDEYLMHLTRYIHLNPCSAKIVEKPELWKYSSYLEYIEQGQTNPITQYKGVLEVKPKSYQKFVNERIDYQQQLSEIKRIMNI